MKKLRITFNSPVVLGFIFVSLAVLILGFFTGGASGVVFAFILLTSFTSFKNGEIPLTFILVAIVFIGQQVYEGLFLQDDISNLSHILGGIIGAVVGFNLNRKR